MLDHIRPGLRRLVVRCGLVLVMALGVLTAPFLAASQPSQRVYRVGHLAAGGRADEGLGAGVTWPRNGPDPRCHRGLYMWREYVAAGG